MLRGPPTLGARSALATWKFAGRPPMLTGLNNFAKEDALRPFWTAAKAPLFSLWITDTEGTSGRNSNALVELDSSDFKSPEHSDGPALLHTEKGAWSDLEIAAEPATGILVALGLVCAGLMRPKKKRSKDPTVWENLG